MTELHDSARALGHAGVEKKYPMSASANETIVRRSIAAIWNRGDLDVADGLFAPDYVNHGGLITNFVRGPEAIKISAAWFRLAFPDLHITVDELSADNDIVVVCWTARTKSANDPVRSPFPANPRPLSGITRSRLAGGKILESWTEWDRARVLRDLGLPPID
jgi:hypothetical protein